MSTSEILYVRGMNLPESDGDEEESEDIWDDRKLNDAYDKALRMANAEVAKRVAMSTNTPPTDKTDDSNIKFDTTHNSRKSPQKKGYKKEWKAGMPCRAVYEVDGLEYEAFLVRFVNDQECVVRFLGYDNTEIVKVNSLKQTLGKAERVRQIDENLGNKLDDVTNDTFHAGIMESSDRAQSVESSDNQRRRKSGKKKKQKQKPMPNFEAPEMPFSMSNFSQLPNFGSMEMPIPPPPPLNLLRHNSDSEEQTVSSMLMSWYMSGYYTGLYQGMKRAKEIRRN